MAQDDVIVMLDADGQHDPKDTPKFIALVKKYPAVFGYRDFSTLPFRHRIANQVMVSFFNLLFGTRFKDLACGYNCFRRDAVRIMLPDLNRMPDGRFNIEMQMKYVAWKRNIPYSQCKISCKYDEVSSIGRGVRMVSGIMLGTLRLRLYGY